MAEEVGGIVYEVGMEVSGLTAGAKQAEDALDSIDKSAQNSSKSMDKLDGGSRNAGKGMGSASSSANSLKTSLTALAGAISVSLVMQWGSAFLEVADSMTQLQARIARLSTDAATAKQTFSDIAAISSRTGSSISETTKLWETLTSSLKEAGATNAQVLNLTDTLQKIGRIGGSSTEEMTNALRQFGQSIASGTIRAEEFNSILEQMPELARQIAAGLGISMGELRQRMLDGKLTAEDALNAIQDRTSVINSEFSKLPRTMSQATNSLETSFATLVAAINNATGASTTMVSIVDSLTSALDRLQGKAMTTSQQIADLTSTGEMYARRARTWSWLGVDGWAAQNTGLARAAGLAVDLAGDMQKVTAETGKAADATKHLTIPQGQTKKADKMILSLEEQNQLLKIQDERQRAVTKARLEARKVTDNPNQISKAGDLAGENFDLQKSEEARKEAQRKSEQQDKRSATAAESVAQKLDKLRAAQDLSAESAEKRRIQEAGLRAEQSLGSGATQKQLNEARALGEANERAALSIQKRKEAEQGQKYAKQEIASAQTTVDPSTGQAVDPLAQINLQEQQKLEALAKYQEIDKQNTQLYEDAKTAIMQQASYQRQAILLQEQQTYQQNVSSLLGESSNFAGSLADAIGQAAGKSSAAYQALFAISKGFAIAQASLNLQTAISNAMAIPWPANIPAIAQALSAGTQIVNAISGINYSGGRKNGGPVSAGSMYEVGENGLPEVFQASNGRQYMIPGNDGSVISNKDLTGGGGGIVINNNVINNSSQATATTTATDNGDGSVTIETIVADIESGGPISNAITSNTTATRRATE